MIDFVGWGWYRARASRTDVWPVVFEAWASDPTTHSATTSWAESLLDSCNKKQDGPKVITFFPFFVSKSKRMYPRLTKYLKYPISGHWNIVLVVALFAFPYVTSTKTSETVLFTRLILTLMNGLAWTQVQAECSWSLQIPMSRLVIADWATRCWPLSQYTQGCVTRCSYVTSSTTAGRWMAIDLSSLIPWI